MTLYDAELAGLSTDQRIRFAKEAEAAGLGFEQRVSGSEGANWTQAVREITIANSAGFVGHHQATSASLSIRVLAEDRGVKQTDFYFVGGRFLSDLGSPAAVGREAARRAVAKLGARNVKSQTVPVVVAPEAGTRFMHWISRAVSGQRVYGRATFLADKLGKQVMSPVVTIIDDPTLHRGPDSYPFDAEGVRAARTVLVQDGVLRGYLTDAYAARRLNMRLSGHATRTYRTTPEIGPSNLYLQKGAAKRQDLLKSVRSGLYLTEVFGTGFNNVTGDFSQGASGFWIEDGELAYPVQGITVAGNILNVLSNVQAVGDDLSFNRGAVTSPTLLVGALTLGGS
jgi:PmbA protein